MKTIYFAGGCFWGVEAYFNLLKGVIATESGYIDGNKANPTYEEVCLNIATHAEAVKIVYNDKVITIEKLLEHFFRIIDPFSLNRQGMDRGIQYRTGIYFDDESDEEIIINYMKNYFKADFYNVKTEIMKNLDYTKAEEYHQDYLLKNPDGYCHVNLNLIKEEERK